LAPKSHEEALEGLGSSQSQRSVSVDGEGGSAICDEVDSSERDGEASFGEGASNGSAGQVRALDRSDAGSTASRSAWVGMYSKVVGADGGSDEEEGSRNAHDGDDRG
jgi:hypothetical protein